MSWLNISLIELLLLKTQIPRAKGSVGLGLRGLGNTLMSRSINHNDGNTRVVADCPPSPKVRKNQGE